MGANAIGYSFGLLAITLFAATILGDKLFDTVSPFKRALLSVSITVMVLAFINVSKLEERFLQLMVAATLAVLIRWRMNVRQDRIAALQEKFE